MQESPVYRSLPSCKEKVESPERSVTEKNVAAGSLNAIFQINV